MPTIDQHVDQIQKIVERLHEKIESQDAEIESLEKNLAHKTELANTWKKNCEDKGYLYDLGIKENEKLKAENDVLRRRSRMGIVSRLLGR